jgi:hypothetical protein
MLWNGSPERRFLHSIVLLAFVASVANQNRARSSVLDIDSLGHLNDLILKHDFLLIAFVSTQCSKSRAIKHNLEWAANRIEEEKLPVKVARVDVDRLTQPKNETETIGSRFGISETPTLKWAAKGNVSGYHGPLSANGIFDWVQRSAHRT